MEVKFYRLGWESPISKTTYDKYVTNVIGENGDGGGIIFAKVDSSIVNISTYYVTEDDPVTGEPVKVEIKQLIEEPPTYYINAAGIEYKVADADVLTNLYKKYLDLIDDTSNSDGIFKNPSSVHKWIQDAMKDYVLTAEKVYAIVDPSNKVYDYDMDPSIQHIVEKSADGIDVSVRTKAGMNSSLLFAVDLDRIYLPRGVQRTEAIGAHEEITDGIVTEGVGMSVKELLEYYLISERFPNPSLHPGSGTFPSYNLTINGTPNDINTYIAFGSGDYIKPATIATNALVEVDTHMKTNE